MRKYETILELGAAVIAMQELEAPDAEERRREGQFSLWDVSDDDVL